MEIAALLLEMITDTRDKTGRGLTAEALGALLAFLDPDRDRAGEKYEEIRLKLTKYFEWENCSFVEELADETINRVARAIDQGREIHDIRAFFFGVSRNIRLESLRAGDKQRRALAEMSRMQPFGPDQPELESALQCLDRCLDALPEDRRVLIMKYYREDQNREDLARTRGLTHSALRNRAHRIRDRLERCVGRCLKERDELVDSATKYI
jgi:DNA-directed RNA polymerase specialized sigma24 family protein